IGLPLPLQAEYAAVKFIALGRRGYRVCFSGIGLAITQNRLADAIVVAVLADDRPVGDPCNGLEMRDTAIYAFVLEMDKPIFARLGFNPSTLMRPIHRRVALV